MGRHLGLCHDVCRGISDDDEASDSDDYEARHLAYQYGSTPPYLSRFQGTIGERHDENKEIVEHESFVPYQRMLMMSFIHDDDTENVQLRDAMKYAVAMKFT